MKAGRVILVGAGPGDPELLTLKALKALQAADVILADDLASDAVLAMANPAARVIHVGKRGGCKSTPQEFIQRLMAAEARAGNLVVRLKGGDPFIFGRGGEEQEALRAEGIACEVVNGITSGLAAATSVGVPLTHRDLCHGAILVSGHEREGGHVDWEALAGTGLPLVVYMGVSRCESICAALAAGGMPPATPVVAVQNATRPDERSVKATLAGLPRAIRDAGLGSPAILIVGDVAALARADSPPHSATHVLAAR
jgi:uroporphyrin-III C-methyltransferase